MTTNTNKAATWLLPWIIPIAFLVLWQLTYSLQWLPVNYLRNISSPWSVFKSGWELIYSGEFFIHLWASAKRAFLGLLIGGSIGFILGIITGTSKFWRLLIDSSLQMLRTIPHLALIPLVVLWFGVDEFAKIFLVALGTFFPIYFNTYHGIKNIDLNLVEMSKSYGLNTLEIFKQVTLPGAMPDILVGLRFSLGIMWLTLIVAETTGSNQGIGYLAMNAREFFQVDIILFTIVIYALLGASADACAKGLEKYFLKWNAAYQD